MDIVLQELINNLTKYILQKIYFGCNPLNPTIQKIHSKNY